VLGKQSCQKIDSIITIGYNPDLPPNMHKDSHFLPIRYNTFMSMVEPWLLGIKNNDIPCVVSYPASDRQRRLLQLQDNSQILTKYLGSDQKYQFITIDFRVDLIESTSDLEKLIYRKLEESSAWQLDRPLPFDRAMESFNKKTGKSMVLVCIGCERMIELEAIWCLIWFTMVIRQQSTRLLLFFERNIWDEKAMACFSQAPAFKPRLSIMTLYENPDVLQFMDYLQETQFDGVTLPTTIRQQIMYSGSGLFLFIKSMCLIYRDNPKFTLTEICQSDEMQFVLENFWKSISTKEQETLSDIVTKKINYEAIRQTPSYRYLYKTKIIHDNSKKIILAVPLLEDFIKQIQYQEMSFKCSNGQVFINNIMVTRQFSPQEINILSKLFKRKNTLVSRDEISMAIWGDQVNEKYSDWAIDSHFSRLRKKLAALRIDPSQLEVKKGKGFVYHP
jgi:DNA-binding winged helix-turn-helix (wHTH) protein